MPNSTMMSDKTLKHIVLNFQNRSFTMEDLTSSIDEVVVEDVLEEIVKKVVADADKKNKKNKKRGVKGGKVKKNSPSYEDRQLEGVDPDRCQCRIWKNGMDNIQCSGKKKEGDFCGRHHEAATSGEWWMGLITETRPEEPIGPPNAKNGPSRHYWTDQEKPEKKKSKSSPKKKKEPVKKVKEPVKEPVKKPVKEPTKEPTKEPVSEMKYQDVQIIFEDVGEDSGEELDLEELEKKEIFDITPCDLEEDIDLDAKEPLPVEEPIEDPVSLPLKKPTAKRCTTVPPLPPYLCCPPIDFSQPVGPVDWGSSGDECEPDDFDYEGVIYKKFPLVEPDGCLVINRISGMQMGYFQKDGTVKFFGDEERTSHEKNKE